jgi:putative membrane protein
MVIEISAADHDRVSAAVRAAEMCTSGEIVTIAAQRSDHYLDVVLAWGLLAIFLVLATLAAYPPSIVERLHGMALGWQAHLSHTEVLVALILLLAVKFGFASWVVSLWPVRMALTPRRVKAKRARARAIDYFRVGAEWRTVGRTAVLIYVSLAEHQVEIVADAAIHSKVAPEAWGHIAVALVDALKDGRPGDGLVAAVEQSGELLARHFPPAGGNPNELPDRLIEIGR